MGATSRISPPPTQAKAQAGTWGCQGLPGLIRAEPWPPAPARMVKGLPQKLFLGQDYRSPLSAKVFSSWDFCIQGQGAATIKKHEISNEFKVRARMWVSVRCECKWE